MIKNYDKIFNLVSLIGITMIWIPLSLILLDGVFPNSAAILTVFVILSSSLGYLLQNIFSAVLNQKNTGDGYASSNNGTAVSFKVKYAIIPVFLIIVFTFITYFVFDAYMTSLLDADIIDYHSEVYSIVASLIFFVSSLSGCIIWFYPIERLSNIYTLIVGCAIFYIETIFAAITTNEMRSGIFNTLLAVSFIIFNISVLIIFNQSTIQKKFRGSVVSVITPKARMYNLFLVMVLVLAIAVTFGIVYVFVNGIYTIGRLIVYLFLFKTFYGKDDYFDPYYDYTYIDPDDATAKFHQDAMTPDNQFIIAIFFVFLAITLFIILSMRTGFFKKMIAQIRAWIIEVFETLHIGIDIFGRSFDPNAEEKILNYKDETKSLQNAQIRDYEGLAANTNSYKLFLNRLSKFDSFDEQTCYAYAVLLRIYREMNVPLKLSDTPREAKAKIARAISVSEIDEITADFERVHYSGSDISAVEYEQILNRICSIIKRHMF